MPQRRADADRRRFFDQFPSVRVSRLRATGAIDPSKGHAIVPFPDGKDRVIYTAHTRLRHGGGWSFFICPRCAALCVRLYLIDGAPRCSTCCKATGVYARSRYGFGRDARLRERDKHLDRMQAQLDTTTPLRFKPAPQHWRGKARLFVNSRSLVGRVRHSTIVCRLAQVASQQTANPGDDGLLRGYRPRAEAARAIDIAPIWKATTDEGLQQALDAAQAALLEALHSTDPQLRLAAVRLFLRTKPARECGW